MRPTNFSYSSALPPYGWAVGSLRTQPHGVLVPMGTRTRIPTGSVPLLGPGLPTDRPVLPCPGRIN